MAAVLSPPVMRGRCPLSLRASRARCRYMTPARLRGRCWLLTGPLGRQPARHPAFTAGAGKMLPVIGLKQIGAL